MSQRTSGLRAILSHPRIYSSFQTLLGARAYRRQIIQTYLRPEEGDRILDIGCGPGDALDHLPQCEYFGFDLSSEYIEAASRRFGSRGTFRCEAVEDATLDGLPPFDRVLAIGVVHHLDDREAESLFRLAHRALKPGGRLLCSDPAFVEGQSTLARALIRRDRGQNVRVPEAYRELATLAFERVVAHVRHDLLSVPYTHSLLVCEKS